MKALVCGIGGQDGAYLSQLLLQRGYEVVGTSRDVTVASFGALKALGLREQVRVVSMAINDFRSVLQTLEREAPREIYNLAGQSSVGLSYEQPVESMESISGGTLNLLEAIRFLRQPVRFYNAGSSECFGDTGAQGATEETAFRPRSPYAVAKATAHWLVRSYRESYGLYACTGILFNHDSPLRPERFVTQKIVRAAARIAHGSCERLQLGNTAVKRDWGWAPDYVRAMWQMLQLDQPADFVIATGRTESLEYFLARAFGHFKLDWREHVDIDRALFRPSDILEGRANPTRAREVLGWRHEADVDDVIARMAAALWAPPPAR